jgi:glucosamine 6-phosphate synthetase-like amidotransferase/phosphosugar isomerase protein
MCGIFGWLKPHTTYVEGQFDLAKIFRTGLIETLERGKDATGFYAPGTGIVKRSIPSTKFVDQFVPDEIAEEPFVIGHCRQASASLGGKKEDLDNDLNAHPFESKNWVLVHNGTVNLPKLKGYKYTSSVTGGNVVDSESILAYIETTSLKNALSSLKGAATVIAYHKPTKKMYFWTDGNRPLAIGFYDGMVFFASTKTILKNSIKLPSDLGIFHKMSFATIYECELLEFDFAKSKFTRKGIIEPKPDIKKEDDDEEVPFAAQKQLPYYPQPSHKGIIHHYNNQPQRTLSRGCVSNPK